MKKAHTKLSSMLINTNVNPVKHIFNQGKNICFPRFVSMEMAAILDLRHSPCTYNFKAASSSAMKSYTHIEDNVDNIYTRVFGFVE